MGFTLFLIFELTTRNIMTFFLLIGADLENMVNQAALKAAIDGDSSVCMKHMDYAKDKVLMGKETGIRVYTPF